MPATSAQILVDDVSCLSCSGMTMADTLRLALWNGISGSITPTPPGGSVTADSTIITVDSDIITSDSL